MAAESTTWNLVHQSHLHQTTERADVAMLQLLMPRTLPYAGSSMNASQMSIHCWMFGVWWSCNLCMSMDTRLAPFVQMIQFIANPTTLPWMHCMHVCLLSGAQDNYQQYLLSTFTTLYHRFTWLYCTLPWLYFALLEFTIDSTMALLDSNRLYRGRTCLYVTLLSLYLVLPGCIWHYLTLLHSTMGPHGTTWLYYTLSWRTTAKTLRLLRPHFRLSELVQVTKECYQIRFLKVHWGVFH